MDQTCRKKIVKNTQKWNVSSDPEEITKSSMFCEKKTSRKPACSRACYLLRAGFLLDLFFETENGSDMFFRNVGLLSTDYMGLYFRR
jgi:hypothetical protein